MEQKPGFLFKVLVIGELATGKTALIKRSVQNIFTEQYRATVYLCLVITHSLISLFLDRSGFCFENCHIGR